MVLVQKELRNAYIGIPNPRTIELDKTYISLDTVGDTAYLKATIQPKISDHTVTWASSDPTVATVAPSSYVPILPAEYQEVEYIQNSTGNEYIDTGVSVGNNVSVEMDIIPVQITGDSGVIGGYWSAEDMLLSYYNGHWRFHNGGNWADGPSAINMGVSTSILLDNTGFTIDGVTTALTAGSSYNYNNSTLLLWIARDTSTGTPMSSSYSMRAQMRSVKIYESSVLVRDLVPCYRKSDNVIGMYDLVNDVFYTNAGSGALIKGPDMGWDVVVTCVSPGECNIIATTVNGLTATCMVGQNYTPTVNTVGYFPFYEDFLDKTGNRTLAVNDCTISNGYANINSAYSYMTPSSTIGGTDLTMSIWYYYGANSGDWNTLAARMGGSYHHCLMPAGAYDTTPGNIGFWNNGFYPSNNILSIGNWYNIIVTKSGATEKMYINGQLVLDNNSSFDNNDYPIGIFFNYDQGVTQGFQGKVSELILEDVVWSQSDVTNYFNMTRKRFGYDISFFTQVKCIESDGSAFINTNVAGGDANKIEISLSDIYQGNGYADSYSYVVFGARANTRWKSSTYHVYDGNRFRYHLGDGSGQYYDCNASQTGAINTNVYDLSSFTVNGTAGTYIGSDYFPDASGSPMCLWFCGNGSYSRYKLYDAKIYDSNDNLLRDLMPCYRTSDGEIGLYDRIGNVFYKNAGGGSFTKTDFAEDEYRFVKWTIQSNRNHDAGYTVQVSEFQLCDSSLNVLPRPTGTYVTCNHANEPGEGPSNIIDGSTSTKFQIDYRYTFPVVLTISLGSFVDFSVYNKYRWYTADDNIVRDPSAWGLALSKDGRTWRFGDIQIANNITTEREALAFTGTIHLEINP